MSLQSYLEQHGIEHFSAVEINPVGKKSKGVVLEPAPMPLWPNIIPTLEVLEWLRKEFESPIHVLSAYRDPVYNKAIGGASNSLHVAFNACDITVKGKTPKQVAAQLAKHPDSLRMGIGTYRGFVHVDTRGLLNPPRKAPARWNG